MNPIRIKSLMSCIPVLALFQTLTIYSSNGWVSLYNFKIQSSRGINLDSQSFYTTYVVYSSIHCSALCSKDIKCHAFYMTPFQESLNGKKGKWECRLLSEPVGENYLSSGDGKYGVCKPFACSTPPELASGVLTNLTRTEHGFAAVYDCTSAHKDMTNLAVAYDNQANRWPSVNQPCASTLCYQKGLSGTLLKIIENPTSDDISYKAQALCQSDEIHVGDAYCDVTGHWFLSEPLYVGCVSKTCFRINLHGMAIYNGTRAMSKDNIECQRWDSQSPRSHNVSPVGFVAEGYNMTAARNYCRDPDHTGYPWCYQMTGYRWNRCDLQRCWRYDKVT